MHIDSQQKSSRKILRLILTVLITISSITLPCLVITKLFPLIWNLRIILPEDTLYVLISIWLFLWILFCLALIVIIWQKKSHKLNANVDFRDDDLNDI